MRSSGAPPGASTTTRRAKPLVAEGTPSRTRGLVRGGTRRYRRSVPVAELPRYTRRRLRRGGRAVDCTGLENRQAARSRGFKSRPLRLRPTWVCLPGGHALAIIQLPLSEAVSGSRRHTQAGGSHGCDQLSYLPLTGQRGNRSLPGMWGRSKAAARHGLSRSSSSGPVVACSTDRTTVDTEAPSSGHPGRRPRGHRSSRTSLVGILRTTDGSLRTDMASVAVSFGRVPRRLPHRVSMVSTGNRRSPVRGRLALDRRVNCRWS